MSYSSEEPDDGQLAMIDDLDPVQAEKFKEIL
jgi:hypothetical protein